MDTFAYTNLYVILEPLVSTNFTSPMPVNVITTNDLPNHIDGLKVLIQVWCVLVIVFGGIGNLIVLVVFSSRWALLSTYEVFIIILSIGDLMEILILRSIQLHEVGGGTFFSVGTTGCKITYFLSSASNYVSSLTLTMISIDRFIAVKWPFKERKKLCRWMIASIWVIACCVAMIYLLGDRVMINKANGLCRMFVKHKKELTIVALVTVLIQNIIPLLVMTTLSILIIHQLHKNSKAARSRVTSGEMRERNRNLQRTTKILFAAIILFFICVTPNNIFYLMYIFNLHELPDELHVFLTLLMMSNSCVNPIIYGRLHTSFRKQTLKLLRDARETLLLFLHCLRCNAHTYSPGTNDIRRRKITCCPIQLDNITCFDFKQQHSIEYRSEDQSSTTGVGKSTKEDNDSLITEFLKNISEELLHDERFQKETNI